ncbi:MAG TPA: transporter [Vicinamibacterales bacterium]|jgi:hypothetical protein
MTIPTRAILILFGILSTAATANAQETLRDALTFLMTNQAVQTGDFERDRAAAEAARDTLARALLVNLTTAPIGTSSGGFLYRLNPELGTVERASQNFGTFFVERAITGGQGSAAIGVMGTTASYNRLNGYDLHDGSFITVANRFRDESQPFDTESVKLRLRASTLSFFANIGVTDELELGVVVPVAQIHMEGDRLNMYRGTAFTQASATGDASGLADIAVRAKYALFSSTMAHLAAAGELRLPTGDEENLLGAGSTSWRLLAIGSFENGPVGFHVNGGIVRGGISDETILSGALSVALTPRATFTAELMRRHVSELRAFELAGAPHPRAVGVDTFRLTAGADASTIMTAITGLKWNVTETVVLGGHVLWSLNDRGLSASMTPTVALEYSIR